MKVRKTGRFGKNLLVISLLAVFCIVGSAVSRRVLSSGNNEQPVSTPSGSRKVQPKIGTTGASKKNRTDAHSSFSGNIIFGSGYYFSQNLDILKDVGGQNENGNLTSSNEHKPVFSADGYTVLFTSYRDGESGSGLHSLYRMDSDGLSQTRLTDSTSNDISYGFSPDGTKIVYAFNNDIWLMNADGTGKSLLVDFDDTVSEPQFSPDGATIVFINSGNDGSIWKINADGSGLTVFDQAPGAETARVAPDGSKVLFSSSSSLWTINIDNTQLTEIIDNNVVNHALSVPAYSPDGSKIVMQCYGPNGPNVCTANADGTNFAPIAPGQGERSYPVWSPDGSTVAFVERNSSTNIYSIFLSTNGGPAQLAYELSNGGLIADLAWQPVCDPIAPTPTPTPQPLNGLISEWNADDGTANDATGINDGQFVGDAALVDPGKNGLGFYFYGNGGYINVPDSDSLDVQTGDYTLSTWFQPTASAEHYIAGKGACGDNASNFYIGVGADFVPFIDISHSSGGSRVGSALGPISGTAFHHLLLRKEGTVFTLFVDGELAVTHTETQEMIVGDQPFTIGKGDDCTAPQLTTYGYVDEVRLYGRALGDDEVSQIYNGTARHKKSGSVTCPATPDPAVKIIVYDVPISAGRAARYRLFLRDPAPAGGTTVQMLSSDPGIANVPVSVFIPEGNNIGDFTASTSVDPTYRSADITATLAGDAVTATVSVAPSAPDVAASNLAAPATVSVLQNFTASWTVTNNGQAATNAYRQDTVYLSPDNFLFNDANDKVVGRLYENDASIAIGASRNVSLSTVNIPAQYIPIDGTYYLFVYAGDGGTVNEGRGSNYDNFVSIPIQVNRNLPDLVAQNIVGPATVEPHVQYYTVTWDVKNQGSAPTSTGYQHNLYYSFDGVVGNADDIILTGRSSGALAVGEVESFSQQFEVGTLPVRPTGDGLIYVTVDVNNTVYEDAPGGPAESNNMSSIPSRFEYNVPDLQVASVTPPVEVETDTPFDLAWTTKNFGSKVAGSTNERVYFSPDAIVNTNDVEIGSFALAQSLAPDQSVDRIQSVSIPTNVVPSTGDYYIYVKADADGAIDEGANENNNVAFHSVHVKRLLRPDLRITNITAPASAFFDQEVQVQWTITNAGTGPTNAPNWQDELYLATSQTNSGATFITRLSNVSSLNAGESYIASATVRIPRGLNGSYYFVMKTDVDNRVNEENETNNLTAKAITLNIPLLPDLRTSNVQAPVDGYGGQPIDVSWTVTNNGSGSTPLNESTWSDAVYLSKDATFSGDDRYIGRRERSGALAANGTYTASNFSVTLPGDVFGDYYVFVVADYAGQVYEFTAEGNNSDYDRVDPGSPMHILGTPPDLAVINPITAPTSAQAGQSINVQFTVKDQGAFDATGVWTDAVYISADDTFDPSVDQLIASSSRAGLAAGQQYGNNLTATIPNCLNGTYYIFVVTDISNRIFEFDAGGNAESNNISLPRPIALTSYAPDLSVTQITVPPVVVNGAMPISWTVKNFGTAATTQTSWTDRIYLLNGTQLVDLGYFDHQGALAIGGEYTQNQIVHVPLFLEGEFEIVILTDAFNSVPECSFEQNNNGSRVTQVGQDLPDLQITGVNGPGVAELGSTFNITWSGKNLSSPMTQNTSWADTVYLSADATLAYGDQAIGGTVVSGRLNTGQVYNAAANVTIPNVAPGSYYLIVNADNGNNVSEGINENNNASTAIPITLTAPQVDLQVTGVTTDPVLYAGQFTNVSWTVANIGTSPTVSDSWTDYVILSRDLVIDPSDRILDFKNHGGVLSAGSTYSETRSVQIPAGLTGEYRIFVITDRNNLVVESNEGNNTSAPSTVDIQLPPPAELNVTNIASPANAVLGQDASFTWTIQNSSANAASGAWQDSVYLSSDQTWDSDDILVGQMPHSGTVPAFGTYTETLTTPMPAVEPGSYYVIVRTDSRNTVRESNESNNLAVSGSPTVVTVENLTLGAALNTSLVTGQDRYYSILNTPADETMLVTLTGEDGSHNELYSRFGSMVSRSTFEYQGNRQGEANQENIVADTTPGTYYTMAHGDYVPSSFAAGLKKAGETKKASAAAAQAVIMKAELLPFGIRTVSPASAGNNGLTFLNIDGAKFQPGAAVKMVGPAGIVLTPLKTIIDNSSNVKALFDLNGKPVGNYQVTLTNPNSQSSTWTTNFQVRSGGGFNVRSEITGSGEVRTGRYYRYTVTTRNEGRNDAIGVPILVILSQQLPYKLSTSNLFEAGTEGFDSSTTAKYLDVDGKRVIPLYAPVVRAGESVNIGIDIQFGGAATITAIALPPLFTPYITLGAGRMMSGGGPDGLDVANCFANLLIKGLLIALSEIIPADCAYSVANALLGLSETAFSNFRGGFDVYSTASSLLQSAINVAGDCAKNAIRYIPWIKFASLLYDIYQITTLALECAKTSVEYVFQVNLSRAIDPNEKLGPVGYGPERWVPKGKPLLYRINFENKPDATAPAQQIRVIDQLPATLDPRTVRLLEMGFKQYRVEVPANRAFYRTRLQLGPDLNDLKADISAGLDVVNGRVSWTFTAIDPATNEQPLNPLAGILPPNNAANDGEGYVIFSVEPLAGQPTRTDIANTATIYFDDNEPIATNATTNLLDADVPVSQIDALPTTANNPSIPLTWTGSDDANGSGLAGLDVFASESGGAFLPFLTGSTATGTTFNGKWGRSYRFYSVAKDNAGNLEAFPDVPDATVQVLGGTYEGDVASRPNGDNDGTVNSQDTQQIRRFAAKIDTDFLYNEFQRADTAPRSTGGDGGLSVADVIQSRRFASGADAVTEYAGPNAQTPFSGKTIEGKHDRGAAAREIYPVKQTQSANGLRIAVQIEAQGDETGVGFTLNYDPSVLTNPQNITLGSDAAGMTVTLNSATSGKLGVIMDKAVDQPLIAGTRVLLYITFDVAQSHGASTTITFDDDPIKNEVADGSATALTTTFSSGVISILSPTAASVPVSGRVTRANGMPIANAEITLRDANGAIQRALTNGLGYYRFDAVEAGRSYSLSAARKGFEFSRPTVILSVEDAVENADFMAVP